jgi:RHS repeat-associated protein
MNRATAKYAYWPSPGRGTFVAAGTNMFLHQDWLGNGRIASAVSGHTVTADRAYAPYGELYNTFGSTNTNNNMFAGNTGDFDPGILFDTPNRELAQYQGRWLSPDPAAAGWNLYAYSTNPNSQVDTSGLEPGDDDNIGDGSDGGASGLSASSASPEYAPDAIDGGGSLCLCADDVSSGALGNTPPAPPDLGPQTTNSGDPSGIQIVGLLFQYQGPNSYVAW